MSGTANIGGPQGPVSGTVGYSLTYSALPGNAGIEARLSNVTRR